MKKTVDIGMVIVTYNRLAVLKDVLDSCNMQSNLPRYILIVNNASNDGTLEYLSYWKSLPTGYEKMVINLECNLGGSGGFYMGLEAAEKLGADWIWVSDDDAVPTHDALKEVENYLSANESSWDKISAICGTVINNGRIDVEHRRWIRQYGIWVREKNVCEEKYESCFELNAFSYVGTIINRNILIEAGLPEKDYFIRWDDTEHSLRLSQYGKIVCVPGIKILHNVESRTAAAAWKYYYNTRNKAYTYKKHFSKWVYCCYFLSSLITSYAKTAIGYNGTYNKIKIQALKDADAGKLGIHYEYRPGWIPGSRR